MSVTSVVSFSHQLKTAVFKTCKLFTVELWDI